MIRILHVLGGLNRGGAETMVMNLYRQVDREKIQFDFIVHAQEKQDYTDEVIHLGGKIYSFPKFSGTNIFEVKKRWREFFLEHPEYKILHSHVRSYASLYFPIAKKYGVKTIIHSHSTSNGSSLLSVAKRLLQFPLKYQADYLFACSQIAGEWLFGKKSIGKSNYHVLPNAINTGAYTPDNAVRNEYRKNLGMEDKTVYIHVGRFHSAKNHIFLLQVFKEVHERQPDSCLILAGDGELRGSIEEKIKALQLEKAVKLLGMRKDIPQLLGAADCFLFPSKWEGLPVTVVEAQAAQLPCFVSDTVTKEVELSELVTYLPIDRGTRIWADAILSKPFGKCDASEEIKAGGFDVSSTAEWLTDFYCRLHE